MFMLASVKRIQMHTLIACAGAISVLMAIESGAANSMPLLIPGEYEVEVRISLPNVRDAAAPLLLTRCISPADLESGQAFFVLSDNPLKNCDLLDYKAESSEAVYRITCPGPNRGSAVAVFEIKDVAYHGVINMNMGGKNMTMTEMQAGKRIGDCP
jgi:hypothetical protein